MNKKLKKIIKMTLLILLAIVLIIIIFFFIGFSKPKQDTLFGVNFSQKHAEGLGLDWKQVYSAILDDLEVKNIKLATYWDFIEGKKDEYYFNDLDWQIKQAEEKDIKLIVVIGMKTPSWPECHIPDWAEDLTKQEQQERVLQYIEQIVLRYKDSGAISYWQVENEPFFPFGECPKRDKKFLKREIELVKSLDPSRKIIVSESGEIPLWFKAASHGDIVGTTLYRKAWFKEINSYISYSFPATFYRRKALLIKWLFNKDVICIELQAEPWGPVLIYDLPLEEQEKTMNLERFNKNIEFARKTNLPEFYLWGAEWWYWLKETQNKPEIWNQAKDLF
jgi:hypothetical protein